MILFSEIFARAIRLFDDPEINRLYATNQVAFAKKMRPFLVNGLGKFVTPIIIASMTNDYDDADGKIEIFDGADTDTYTLSTIPAENAELCCMIDGKIDFLATYNAETQSVTFSKVVTSEQQCSVEWYYAGAFTADFTKSGAFGTNSATVVEQTKNILAHCLALSWAEQSKNFLLDIRNWLQDTDFKLYSPAHAIESKIKWHKDVERGLDDLTNSLGWLVRTNATYAAGGKVNGR